MLLYAILLGNKSTHGDRFYGMYTSSPWLSCMWWKPSGGFNYREAQMWGRYIPADMFTHERSPGQLYRLFIHNLYLSVEGIILDTWQCVRWKTFRQLQQHPSRFLCKYEGNIHNLLQPQPTRVFLCHILQLCLVYIDKKIISISIYSASHLQTFLLRKSFAKS